MRPLWKYTLIGGGVFAVILICALTYAASRMEPMAREYVETALAERFGSDVTLDGVGISLLAGPVITARGITLRHGGREDVPPFIQIQKLVVRTSVRGLMSTPRRVHQVELEGLRINVPPKREGERRVPMPQGRQLEGPGKAPDFVIEEIKADGTILRTLPKDPWREPLEWDLKKLKLETVGPGRPMSFKATLRNAKPPGDIQTTGSFGPWASGDPGQTPVSGEYQFRNADLSVFKGIGGMLSSDGRYSGILERLDVEGTTDTPDFRLNTSGNRLPLKTQFKAVVDGTTGDTLLQPVKAQLANTSLLCRGGVVGKQGIKGKTVDLDVSVERGRIDDILRLAVRSKPPMLGAMRMKAKLVIPPGDRDVVDKMRLAGHFNMDRVQFTNAEVQTKIDEMSQKARGAHDPEPDRVASQFGGKFQIGSGTISLQELTFEIPGATVQVAGSYGMRNEQIDMSGQLRMQARISQTVRGVKSILLKAVDPFFAKDGAGAVIPIYIEGTRDQPKFGLNWRRGNKDAEEERARKRDSRQSAPADKKLRPVGTR